MLVGSESLCVRPESLSTYPLFSTARSPSPETASLETSNLRGVSRTPTRPAPAQNTATFCILPYHK